MEEASTRLVLAVGGLAGEWVRPPPPVPPSPWPPPHLPCMSPACPPRAVEATPCQVGAARRRGTPTPVGMTGLVSNWEQEGAGRASGAPRADPGEGGLPFLALRAPVMPARRYLEAARPRADVVPPRSPPIIFRSLMHARSRLRAKRGRATKRARRRRREASSWRRRSGRSVVKMLV